MELYREILVHALTRQDTSDSFSDLLCMLSQIVETTCYNTLQKIKAIIHDDSLEDRECFLKMEEIICVLRKSEAMVVIAMTLGDSKRSRSQIPCGNQQPLQL